jgi:hypothetical protein
MLSLPPLPAHHQQYHIASSPIGDSHACFIFRWILCSTVGQRPDKLFESKSPCKNNYSSAIEIWPPQIPFTCFLLLSWWIRFFVLLLFRFNSWITTLVDSRLYSLDVQSARPKASTQTEHNHRINTRQHPCLEQDSNSRTQSFIGRSLLVS